MKRILVANRGEIAVRIIRALRELGKESVAIYSDADRHSLHRSLADFAIRLPGELSSATYLNIPLILEAIKISGADGVHPGYGFLSENAQFADAITQLSGVTFIGPTPNAMRIMGDKISAKRLMQEVGVPVVPGSDGALTNVAEIKAVAERIGFPLILKAAGGGGGRGMRKVTRMDELETALATCQREAREYFGSDAVFCERYIAKGRHIEFQVLCDQHGNGVHLFERDCSIQRRHQKLVEEAPSVFLDQKTRERLGEIALKAAKAVKYEGVGTVEFICEDRDHCYFMEMNTRIQVEHPATEMITGIDLITEQIKVAEGVPLKVKQQDIKLNGWAIEVRINAEDATQEFMASPGTIEHLRFPQGPGVRIDSHLYAGYTIPRFYDSMIAKIIVWGSDRNHAMARMRRALHEFEIQGIPTTAKFHEALLAHPDFIAGNFTTGFLEEQMLALEKLMGSNDVPLNDHSDLSAIMALCARRCHQESANTQSNDRVLWSRSARSENGGG